MSILCCISIHYYNLQQHQTVCVFVLYALIPVCIQYFLVMMRLTFRLVQIGLLITLFELRAGSSISPQIPSATNATCNCNSSHIWYHVDRHERCKRVTQPVVFVKDLGLALASKMRPDKSQAFKEVNNSQAIPQEETIFSPNFFLNEPLPGAPRHVCTKFRANVRRTTAQDQY